MILQSQTWIWGQTLWLALAIGYNLVGILRVSQGGKALIDGAPEKALIGLLPFIVMIGLAWIGKHNAWFWLSLILLPGLLYIGVWRHIGATMTTGGLDAYTNHSAWVAAILINVWGCVTIFMGLASHQLGE